MIYRFDEDWNGKVIGESKCDDMDSYLDLHFPSSDIPKQARQLYLKNPYRLIPDINYKPSMLTPEINTAIAGITDLSDCNSRSVAQVHLKYLNNMNVQASMSVAIIKDNQLWGIVACHNKTIKHVSYEIRSAFELLSNILSQQIVALEISEVLTKRIRHSSALGILIDTMLHENDFAKGLSGEKASLLKVLNISSAAIIYEDKFTLIGDDPDQGFISKLVEWYQANYSGQIFYCNNLPIVFEPAIEFAKQASGTIILPIFKGSNYYIIGFREEYIRTITWAGNPEHAKGLTGDINHLNPRNSFSQFQDKFRNQSIKWDLIEIEMAENLLKAVLKTILRSQIMRRLIAEEKSYQLSIIAQKTSNAIVTFDKEGNVEWVNNAFEKLTGKEIKTLSGKKLNNILRTSIDTKDTIEWMNSLSQNDSFIRDVIIKKENKDLFFNFNFTRVKGDSQSLDKVIAIGTDITALNEKTDALKAINKKLDEYAYIVSHDLKAPLTAIEGLVNILSDDKHLPPEEHSNIITMLKASVKKMNKFIENILIKAKSGTQLEVVNLNKMFEELLVWTSFPIEKITFVIDPNLPEIKTDKVGLMQVLGNLLSNAVKYGCTKNKHCIIKAAIKIISSDLIEFSIKDNGKGISEEHQKTIFNLFDTGKEIGSTGIGLATVKNLVEANNGKVWLRSKIDGGSTFYFTWTIA